MARKRRGRKEQDARPPEVEAGLAALARQLGPTVRVHAVPLEALRVQTGCGFAVLGLGVFLALFGLVASAAGTPAGPVFGLVALAVCAVLGVRLLLHSWLRRGWVVVLCERGLGQVYRGRARGWTWDQVAAVWEQQPSEPPYRIQMSDGSVVRLVSDLPERHHLVAAVRGHVDPRIMADVLRRVEAGEKVAFGPFTLGPDGVGRRWSTLPWAEVGHTDVQLRRAGPRGGSYEVVSVHRREGGARWAEAGAARVPNLTAFRRLVAALAGRPRA